MGQGGKEVKHKMEPRERNYQGEQEPGGLGSIYATVSVTEGEGGRKRLGSGHGMRGKQRWWSWSLELGLHDSL